MLDILYPTVYIMLRNSNIGQATGQKGLNMKYTKIEAGVYESENGYRIVKNNGMNIFTGKPMSDAVWHIYKNHKKVDFALTLKEAKAVVEAMSKED